MTQYKHKSGEVWNIPSNSYWILRKLKCRGCGKLFKEGERVVQIGTHRTWFYTNSGYSKIRHIECYVDAKGNQIVKA